MSYVTLYLYRSCSHDLLLLFVNDAKLKVVLNLYLDINFHLQIIRRKALVKLLINNKKQINFLNEDTF